LTAVSGPALPVDPRVQSARVFWAPAQYVLVALDPTTTLPAEAFIRLIYGRLDPEHTPELAIPDIDLDTLRRGFPGV